MLDNPENLSKSEWAEIPTLCRSIWNLSVGSDLKIFVKKYSICKCEKTRHHIMTKKLQHLKLLLEVLAKKHALRIKVLIVFRYRSSLSLCCSLGKRVYLFLFSTFSLNIKMNILPKKTRLLVVALPPSHWTKKRIFYWKKLGSWRLHEKEPRS